MNTSHALVPQYVPHAGAPSPLVLTDRELVAEVYGLALRIAHSDLPMRDVRLVQELAARLGRSA